MQIALAIFSGLLTIFLSISILYRLLLKKHLSPRHFIFHLPGSFLSAVFLFFFGAWAFTTFYLQWAFLILYMIALIWAIAKRIKSRDNKPGSVGRAYIVSRSLFTLFMGFMVFAYLDGRHYEGEAVDLKFPFRSGKYYVMQGGANRLDNPAHRNFSMKKFGFAMDISKLYPTGNRAKGMMPANVTDYAIYRDTILSPCTGKVIKVCDTVHTNLPGHVNRAWVHGNHMVIQSNGYRVFLAHFIKEKIFVKEGDEVTAGQPLGLSGNSGFSIEPHLHINVFKDYEKESKGKIDNFNLHYPGKYNDPAYSGTSVPFTFEGEFYIINDIIEPK
jgi:hypothetical protein